MWGHLGFLEKGNLRKKQGVLEKGGMMPPPLPTDKTLNRKDLAYDIATKLNRANGLLYKIRNCYQF